MAENKEIIRRVGDIYKWIEAQQLANKDIAGQCDACGKCCDFQSFGHRLYITTPEMLYFVDKVGSQNIKQMTREGCCYQVDGKCTVHPFRFSGCRIFCCKGAPVFQSDLTETVIKKFKALCDEFQIPYRYVDLPTALNTFSSAFYF